MAQKQQNKIKVLLVDDEEDFIESLTKRLELRGLDVTGVTCGKEALSLADHKQFDAIILDLAMPGMNGLETLMHLKKTHPDAEIIMLTGQGTIPKGLKAMKLGAFDFLEKPVDIRTLLNRIKEARNKRILILPGQSDAEINELLKNKSE